MYNHTMTDRRTKAVAKKATPGEANHEPRGGKLKMPLALEDALTALIQVKPESKPPNGEPKKAGGGRAAG